VESLDTLKMAYVKTNHIINAWELRVKGHSE